MASPGGRRAAARKLNGAWWPGVSGEDLELTIHLADGTVLPDVPVFDH